MNYNRFSRLLHKWLALFVGIQLVLWMASGFYMVVVDLDFIHGDPLVRNLRSPVTAAAGVPVSEVASRYNDVSSVAYRSIPGTHTHVYEVTSGNRKLLVDAQTGELISPLSEEAVRALARNYYAGKGDIASVSLLTSDPPTEIAGRALPLWRVDFNDGLETSFYVHPDTGVLVTRRHRFWRWFDFLWMLHIMDYESRTDVNNTLLKGTSVLATITVLSGTWLLYYSFFRRRRPVDTASAVRS